MVPALPFTSPSVNVRPDDSLIPLGKRKLPVYLPPEQSRIAFGKFATIRVPLNQKYAHVSVEPGKSTAEHTDGLPLNIRILQSNSNSNVAAQ